MPNFRLLSRFECVMVDSTAAGDAVMLKAAGADANKSWSTGEPAGSLVLSITNPDARGVLKPGVSYSVTIEPAPIGI